MKKLRIFEHISLDGVIQSSADENDFPYGDWSGPYRSSTLTSPLLEHGLADEVVLLVNPVLLGTGKRIFGGATPPRAFALASTASFAVRHHHQCLQGRRALEEPIISESQIIRSTSMRFMMIVIPKGYESGASDAVPSAEAVAKMMEYNKALQKAGVLLALDGLFPPSTGARVSYADGKARVTDG